MAYVRPDVEWERERSPGEGHDFVCCFREGVRRCRLALFESLICSWRLMVAIFNSAPNLIEINAVDPSWYVSCV
jgi:hypothetical protein